MQRRFERAEKILAVLGPDATLRRGYSMTMDATGNRGSFSYTGETRRQNSHACH